MYAVVKRYVVLLCIDKLYAFHGLVFGVLLVESFSEFVLLVDGKVHKQEMDVYVVVWNRQALNIAVFVTISLKQLLMKMRLNVL